MGKKEQIWNHFVAEAYTTSRGFPTGVTGPRLRKIKKYIFDDEDFWNDIIYRHKITYMSIRELKLVWEDVYSHCKGNFWGMIVQTLVEKEMIR